MGALAGAWWMMDWWPSPWRHFSVEDEGREIKNLVNLTQDEAEDVCRRECEANSECHSISYHFIIPYIKHCSLRDRCVSSDDKTKQASSTGNPRFTVFKPC